MTDISPIFNAIFINRGPADPVYALSLQTVQTQKKEP